MCFAFCLFLIFSFWTILLLYFCRVFVICILRAIWMHLLNKRQRKVVHSRKLKWKLNSSSEHVHSSGSVHSARTDWALTVLVSLQPIKSWRWREWWPMNASSNWVDFLQIAYVWFSSVNKFLLTYLLTFPGGVTVRFVGSSPGRFSIR